MPRYYFNVEGDLSPDIEGVELADLATAKCEAVKVAGHIVCESAGDFWDKHEWQMTVTDETGLSLFTLHVFGTESPSTQSGSDH